MAAEHSEDSLRSFWLHSAADATGLSRSKSKGLLVLVAKVLVFESSACVLTLPFRQTPTVYVALQCIGGVTAHQHLADCFVPLIVEEGSADHGFFTAMYPVAAMPMLFYISQSGVLLHTCQDLNQAVDISDSLLTKDTALNSHGTDSTAPPKDTASNSRGASSFAESSARRPLVQEHPRPASSAEAGDQGTNRIPSPQLRNRKVQNSVQKHRSGLQLRASSSTLKKTEQVQAPISESGPVRINLRLLNGDVLHISRPRNCLLCEAFQDTPAAGHSVAVAMPRRKLTIDEHGQSNLLDLGFAPAVTLIVLPNDQPAASDRGSAIGQLVNTVWSWCGCCCVVCLSRWFALKPPKCFQVCLAGHAGAVTSQETFSAALTNTGQEG